MRRTDREITDREAIYDVLRYAEYGTLSFVDGDRPYAVPMSCGFYLEDGEPFICWHGADAGTKIALLHQNPHVAYSCVSECRRDFAPERLHWSFYYKSACASGRAVEVKDFAEKARLLDLLLAHYGEHDHPPYPAEMLRTISVWKCHLDRITGKQHVEKKV